jgi:uncharacterized repeat protein (TIGR01451 family)
MRLELEPLEDRRVPTILTLATATSSGSLNGALFHEFDPSNSTGTGLINSFVRIDAAGFERGYNTLGATEFDTVSGSQAIRVSDVPLVSIDNVNYREFFLDANESNGTPLISLQQLQVFLGSAADLTGYPTFGGQATKVYDLDVGLDGDSRVDINTALFPGSGHGDLLVFIPDSVFTDPNLFVYFYSAFGATNPPTDGFASDGGFEEWSVGANAQSLVPLADLSLSKFVDNAAPAVGQQVTFFVTVSNAGPADATGVVVTDLLPPGLSFDSANASLGNYDSGTGVWTVGALANGASAFLTITATVTSLGVKINTAEVTASDLFDPDSAVNNHDPTEDDQASVTVTPLQVSADLGLTKTVDNLTPNVGDTITFTITLSNAGPANATNVAVSDLLPAGLAFVSATASQGTYDSGSGTWLVGTVIVGTPVTLQIQARVTDAITHTNVAAISQSDAIDDNPSNNSASATETPLPQSTPLQQADLSVAKVVSQPTALVGTPVVYTLFVHNNGPNTATGVAVSDPLPAGIMFLFAEPSQGSFDPVSGTWNVGAVGAGATASLRIVAVVTAPGTIINTAQVTAAVVDPNPSNNQASTTLVGTAAPVAVSKRSFLQSSLAAAGALRVRNARFVVTAFRALLGRNPDPLSLAVWSGWLNRGFAPAKFVQALMRSRA